MSALNKLPFLRTRNNNDKCCQHVTKSIIGQFVLHPVLLRWQEFISMCYTLTIFDKKKGDIQHTYMRMDAQKEWLENCMQQKSFDYFFFSQRKYFPSFPIILPPGRAEGRGGWWGSGLVAAGQHQHQPPLRQWGGGGERGASWAVQNLVISVIYCSFVIITLLRALFEQINVNACLNYIVLKKIIVAFKQ